MTEVGVLLFSALLTVILRKLYTYKNVVDVPNSRSSHNAPTPRGGGLAIVIAFYIGSSLLYLNGLIPKDLYWALWTAVPVAIVSFIDDLFDISAKIRLSVQIISAVMALAILHHYWRIDLYFWRLEGGITLPFLLLILIWMTNLYNFLDGIDGYAGMEAIYVSLSAFIFFHNEIFLMMAASVGGFLIFNWERATIFMGDVGSAYLGFLFGVFIVYFSRSEGATLIWVMLLSLFWVDATLTLYRRFMMGEPITLAHKKHAYQRAVQAGFRHSHVVCGGMLLNMVSLLILIAFRDSPWLPISVFFWITVLYMVVRWIDKHKPMRDWKEVI